MRTANLIEILFQCFAQLSKIFVVLTDASLHIIPLNHKVMRTKYLSNNLLKKLFLLLLYVYCLMPYSQIAAQVKKADPQMSLPLVSNEVFQTIAQFFEYDRNIPLDAKIISEDEFEGSKKEKIVFTGVNNSKVPAYLIIPNDGGDKHPIVFLVDGIYGSKERWLDDNSWPKGGLVTKALLKNGIAVMMLDAVYHGERAAENAYVSPPWPFAFPYKARHMVIQTAIEYRRAIDYVSTRNDIDTTRIGMMGLSMGGLITFELSSIDSRIKTAAAGVTPILRIPELQSVDVNTFANHVSCNSFLMFMGNKDGLYTMKEARQLYDLIPITQKEFVEYNSGHQPPVEYVGEVTNWFVKYLKP